MYPSPQTPIASTSGLIPRPSSRFQPITPVALSPVQMTDAVSEQIEPQSNGSSPDSSLPCGQNTHMALINPSAQQFIPGAAEHQIVPGSPGQGTSKSVNGEGVKNSRQQGKSSAPNECLCYPCKQPDHLKKDCPELPYCSKCRTRGHIPARCPTKLQDSRQLNKGHKFQEGGSGKNHKTRRGEWKRAQDQPQFSNKDNKCLNCTGDDRTHDCPTRQRHQAPTTNNPASGSGIYQHQNKFPIMPSQQHSSPQQHSPQSQSTLGVTTPT